MSSELLGSAQNVLKGNLGGAWDITNGYQDAYTDLGIARRFGGAAAAYSLRDIGAMNGPVVRVRRNSDDEEEDFSANQVSSGALEDWVNGKLESTLPADVATAAAAYSLRKVKENYTGPVVRIRRSSDNTEGDFTAQELEDGTATDFIDGGESLLYGICGQSNAAGRAGNSFAGDRFDELDALSNRVFMWDTTTTSFVEYDFGVNQQKSSNSPVTQFGPESELLRLAAEANPTKKIYVVKYAIGSTSLFNDWSPGDTYYNTFKDAYLNAVSAIQASNENIIHKGVLFAQGEEDAKGALGGGAQNYYESYQRSFIETLRTDLSLPNLPIALTLPSVRTTQVSNFPQIDIVSQAKVNVAASLEFVSTIDSSNFGMNTDDLHYNADGQIEQGTQFYNQANGIETSTGTGDGYVRTWYDQAGSNDAIQETAANQPKIAENGALLADGIDFDGSNDELRTSTDIASSQPVTVISVTKPDAVNKRIFESITNSVRAFYGGGSNTGMNAGNTLLGTTNEVSTNTEYLQTHLFNTTNSKVFLNNVETISDDAGSNAFAGNFSLGGSSAVFDGTMKEVIVYLSDQSDNRFKIESNINNYYGLYTFQGDGFVETLYDQSGNGNDVSQTTAGSQPKIVDSGSLVKVDGIPSIKFDGTDDFLERATYTQGDLSQPSTAFAVAKLRVFVDDNQKIFDGHTSTKRNMIQLNQSGSGQFAAFAGTVQTTGEDADADQHLFESRFNGADSRFIIDGVIKSTNNQGSQDMQGINIGANHDSASNFWDGDIQEIIIYNSDLCDDRADLENDINNYYTIY